MNPAGIRALVEKTTSRYSLDSIGDDAGDISIRVPSDIRPNALSAIVETIRSMPGPDNPDFRFVMETGMASQAVPAINLIPDRTGQDTKSRGGLVPLVIFLHGFGTSKEKSLRYGIRFAANGYYAALIDLPDHGERMTDNFHETYGREGADTVEETGPFRMMNRLMLMKRSVEELDGIVGHYSGVPGVDPGRMGIAGISMGGTVALLYSYLDARIRAAASYICPLGYGRRPESVPDVGAIGPDVAEFVRSMDPLYAIGEFRGTAVLAQFGAVDPVTGEPALSEFEGKMRALYAPDSGRFKILRHAGAGHEVTGRMIEETLDWFAKYL